MPEESTTPDLALLTRRSFELIAGREFDALMGFFGAESVLEMTPWGLGTHEGPAAIRRFLEDWFGGYETFELVPEGIVDLGNGVVLAVGRQAGRAHGWRAADLRLRHASVFVWAEAVAVQVITYRDLDEARAAGERLAASRAGLAG